MVGVGRQTFGAARFATDFRYWNGATLIEPDHPILPLIFTPGIGRSWPSALMNLIGEVPDTRAILAVEGAHLHLYGKAPRPGRKLGHVSVVAADEESLDRSVDRLVELIGRESVPTP